MVESVQYNTALTITGANHGTFKSIFPLLVLLVGTNLAQIYKLLLHLKFLLIFIRPKPAGVYKIYHSKELKLITRLRLGLYHLREHKFRHNLNDTIYPFCLCGTNI